METLFTDSDNTTNYRGSEALPPAQDPRPEYDWDMPDAMVSTFPRDSVDLV